MDLDKLTSDTIKAAINVHKELGPGLLESVYQACLVLELKAMEIRVQSEALFPVYYRDRIVQDEG